MIVAILQRISCSPAVASKVAAASSRLGPALGTTFARYVKQNYSTSTTDRFPYTKNHAFDFFDVAQKTADALKHRQAVETKTSIDPEAFIPENVFDENETLTKTSRLAEIVEKRKKPKTFEPHPKPTPKKTHKKSKDSESVADTTFHAEEFLEKNAFDSNETLIKASRAAEHAKHFTPAGEEFHKEEFEIESTFDENEELTKTSRLAEKVGA